MSHSSVLQRTRLEHQEEEMYLKRDYVNSWKKYILNNSWIEFSSYNLQTVIAGR